MLITDTERSVGGEIRVLRSTIGPPFSQRNAPASQLGKSPQLPTTWLRTLIASAAAHPSRDPRSCIVPFFQRKASPWLSPGNSDSPTTSPKSLTMEGPDELPPKVPKSCMPFCLVHRKVWAF